MLAEMLSAGSGGGSLQIPFNLDVSSLNRATIISQDNYIYEDNGVGKVHIDTTFRASVSMSNKWNFAVCAPIMTTGIPDTHSDDWGVNVIADSSRSYLGSIYSKKSISAGTTFTVAIEYDL